MSIWVSRMAGLGVKAFSLILIFRPKVGLMMPRISFGGNILITILDDDFDNSFEYGTSKLT